MKKQTKADKAFIAKIKSLNVVTKQSDAAKLSAMAEEWGVPETIEAPDGSKMKLAGGIETEVTVRCRRRKPKRDTSAEQSLAA